MKQESKTLVLFNSLINSAQTTFISWQAIWNMLWYFSCQSMFIKADKVKISYTRRKINKTKSVVKDNTDKGWIKNKQQ